MNPTALSWLEKLLTLAPIIAFGVHTMKADASLGDKTAMAQDALTLAIAGAQATVPQAEQGTVNSLGTIAQNVMTGVLTTLHNNSQPAPQGT